jgi:lipoprotein-anchoring transpeptidase ErfK/SrfK
MVRSVSVRRALSWIAAVWAVCLMSTAPLGSARAHVVEAYVDLTNQRMNVAVNGRHYASWAISSGRKGYRTPTGTYQPKRLRRMHYSKKYDDAPMPYSIFFHKGYAIHGTDKARQLGRPASHGCVRLAPRHAAELYALVMQYGRANTRIHVSY